MEMKKSNNCQLIPRGKRFKNYLQDMLNGEQYRVESFEEDIRKLGEELGLERIDMIKAYLEVMEAL